MHAFRSSEMLRGVVTSGRLRGRACSPRHGARGVPRITSGGARGVGHAIALFTAFKSGFWQGGYGAGFGIRGILAGEHALVD